jgi:chitin synthase
MSHIKKDLTKSLAVVPKGTLAGQCLISLYSVGKIETQSIGCFASNTVLIITLAIVICLIITRFILAIWFQWFISNALGRLENDAPTRAPKRRQEIMKGKFAVTMADQDGFIHTVETPIGFKPSETLLRRRTTKFKKSQSTYGSELYTIMLVTCYSEVVPL